MDNKIVRNTQSHSANAFYPKQRTVEYTVKRATQIRLDLIKDLRFFNKVLRYSTIFDHDNLTCEHFDSLPLPFL